MTAAQFLTDHIHHAVEMLVLLVFSGFFSGTETALFSLTEGQMQQLREAGTGRSALALMASPARTLNTLLLGNMAVNVAYAGVSAVIVLAMNAAHMPTWLGVLVSLGLLLVLILFGEVTPKMIAGAIAERWATAAAPVLLAIGKVLAAPLRVLETLLVKPMTRILAPRRGRSSKITADELSSVLDLSVRRGLIGHGANAMLQEIVELTDLRVSDIMVPRVDMIAYGANGPREGLLDLFRRTRLRRIPLYDGDLDHILGMVHAKRVLFQKDTPLEYLVVPTPFAPETGNLERLLMLFRAKRAQTAIVVDEYGGTAGLVTLEDVLEEIVGDISEAGGPEEAPAVEQVEPGVYLMNANLAIHELADAFRIDLAGQRISTVGGFVVSQLGRIARKGDTVAYRNLNFTVETIRRGRIGRLRLALQEEEETS